MNKTLKEHTVILYRLSAFDAGLLAKGGGIGGRGGYIAPPPLFQF